MMKRSGITDDQKPVIDGVGTFCFTHGVPLELVLEVFNREGLVVGWLDYIQSALKDGHKPRTIKARIEAAVGDVFGKQYLRHFQTRLDKVL